jgi:uncharacterized protein (TIGR02145 family)
LQVLPQLFFDFDFIFRMKTTTYLSWAIAGMLAAAAGWAGCKDEPETAITGLPEGFTVDAADIGVAADSVSGTITGTGSSDYRVRSMGGTWWMLQNADKPLTAADDGCTYSSLDRAEYGQLYSWSCASSACPPGWALPTNADVTALATWLTSHSMWSEWNSGFAAAGFGNNGSYEAKQDVRSYWWRSSENKGWYVDTSATTGTFNTTVSSYSFSVRCRKIQ